MTACETFGSRLKEKRVNSRGTAEAFSQIDVAATLQVSQSYVSIMERGLKDFYAMHPRKLLRVLRAYHFEDAEIVDLAREFGFELPAGANLLEDVESIALPKTTTVPIFPAGTALDEWQTPSSHISFPATMLDRDDQLYGLLMVDDDMAPYLPKGSYAVTSFDAAACASGDVYAIAINDIVYVRRVILHKGKPAFVEALNPDAEERFRPVHDGEVLGSIVMRVLVE